MREKGQTEVAKTLETPVFSRGIEILTEKTKFLKYEEWHKRRLSLKPGITGLWQVSGRSSITEFEDVVKLDLEYIDNWSIWEDIRILFKTVLVVLFQRGAE